VEFYRQCKERYNIDNLVLGLQTCRFDSDCVFGGFRSKCNKVTNRCHSDYELERVVLSCIVDGLDIYTEQYLSELLSLPKSDGNNSQRDSKWFDAFETAYMTKECVNEYGDQHSERSSQLYTTKSPTCGGQIGGCTTTRCLE